MNEVLDAYVIVPPSREGGKDYWMKVGRAWSTKTGGGYRLVLHALPPSGELVLMPPLPSKEGAGNSRK